MPIIINVLKLCKNFSSKSILDSQCNYKLLEIIRITKCPSVSSCLLISDKCFHTYTTYKEMYVLTIV